MFHKLKVFPLTSGTINLTESGIYTAIGSTALSWVIPSAADFEEQAITFICRNISTQNVTITSNGNNFNIDQATTNTFILRPNSSALIFWDGNVWHASLCERSNSTQRFAPTTGTTSTVTQTFNENINVFIVPAGALAALTIALPGTPYNGQHVNVTSTRDISSLTISNGTVLGAISSLTANVSVKFVYSSTDTAWILCR